MEYTIPAAFHPPISASCTTWHGHRPGREQPGLQHVLGMPGVGDGPRPPCEDSERALSDDSLPPHPSAKGRGIRPRAGRQCTPKGLLRQ
eukprot:4377-Pyramimonas_sp.AAC.1